VLLEIFEALLESVHAGPMVDYCLIPLGLFELREVRMGEPKFLKLKGLELRSVPGIHA
jgi:hypothetical protein